MAEKKTEIKETEKKAAVKYDKKKATGLRIGAWIFWLLGIACEVVGILFLRKELYIEKIFGFEVTTMMMIIAALVLDLIFVIIGSQLWKNSNHYDPVKKSDSGIKKFFQNQLGVIIAIIAFAPILILLLTDKETLAGKDKKIVSIVAIAALAIALIASVDFNAPTADEFDKSLTESGQELTDTVNWTLYGHSYHKDGECQTLSRTKPENLFSGSLQESFDAGRYDPCDYCYPELANEPAA